MKRGIDEMKPTSEFVCLSVHSSAEICLEPFCSNVRMFYVRTVLTDELLLDRFVWRTVMACSINPVADAVVSMLVLQL